MSDTKETFVYSLILTQECIFLCYQLEWSMKLWWPHCEALIALLMAYNNTKKPTLLHRFSEVYEYTFSHVSSFLFQNISGIVG